ncbi:MAG TPA: SRPBCC family protein [Candidatus Limnocylindria bacterium]|jgi:hypothetical protein|nr:SRPBCC family protein [Candidatus Limnocylindria bacterium]
MLKKILLGLVVIIAIFLAVVAFQPANFNVTRTTTIAAPVSAVFGQVNDFHNWPNWSPWAKLDPAMKDSYDGPVSGTGAHYQWSGDSKVGKGAMTITESRANELVRIKLEFIEPFAAVNTADFAFKSEGNQTTVTWSMYGENNFLSKAMCLFVSMDKMVGGDFEKGLAQMKSTSEAAAKK